jgi:heavy metal translocating P-type ATPase
VTRPAKAAHSGPTLSRESIVALLTLGLLIVGGLAHVVAGVDVARRIGRVGLWFVGAPVVWTTLRNAARGKFAADIVASLSIIGAVALNQPLAGLVIVLMQSGGEGLERFAEGRASAAVRALEEAAPRMAHLISGEHVEDVPVDRVAIGDHVLVRPGDLVPTDGEVTDGNSELDTAALTGEAAPMSVGRGTMVMSGSVNGSGLLRVRVTAVAAESQYARIVELVRTAQESKAPVQRLADRYAIWFTPATLIVCALTFAATHDWLRVLSILVVATPCPLLLATPIAIVGGVNRAAQRSIIVRNGGALEQLSRVNVAVFDKTGTLTIGRPLLRDVHAAHGFESDEVLRLAAAVEQGSSHQLARVVVTEAERRFGVVPSATHDDESPGKGVTGHVDGVEVVVGGRAFVLSRSNADTGELARLEQPHGTLLAYVAIGGKLAGTLEYADELRPELPSVLASLKRWGISRTLLLSGDHTPNARAVAEQVGITEVQGDLRPEDKASEVRALRAAGAVVLMVGDGTNDAPALSGADVGVALAGHGGGITAEAADVIILIDSLARVIDAIAIGHRTMHIARQSIWAGLGLSAAAMVVAAFGYIPPTVGAMLQEGIDVAVIFNALRAAAPFDSETQNTPPALQDGAFAISSM